MQIKTELGMVEVSSDTYDNLRPKLTDSNPVAEIERIVRVAMQAETRENAVANRLAISTLATNSIAKLVIVRGHHITDAVARHV